MGEWRDGTGRGGATNVLIKKHFLPKEWLKVKRLGGKIF
jgi:hypothetical protein